MTKGCALENKIEHARFQALCVYYIIKEWTHPKKAVLVSLGVLWGRGVVPTAQGQGEAPGEPTTVPGVA